MPIVRMLAVLAVCSLGCVTASSAQQQKRDVSELVTLEGDSIVVRETINFEHGKAEIDPHSTDLLDAVAEIMKRNDSITRLSIEGHTDTTGEPAANQPLSEARAQAVLQYLESKGIDPKRLEARGFGHSRPIDTNDTEAGRAKNRRVEFKVTR